VTKYYAKFAACYTANLTVLEMNKDKKRSKNCSFQLGVTWAMWLLPWLRTILGP